VKDVIIAFFMSFGFASGTVLTIFVIEANKQATEATILIEQTRKEILSLQDASKECEAITATKIKNKDIVVQRPVQLPPSKQQVVRRKKP
jgi:hypothetical protein